MVEPEVPSEVKTDFECLEAAFKWVGRQPITEAQCEEAAMAKCNMGIAMHRLANRVRSRRNG